MVGSLRSNARSMGTIYFIVLFIYNLFIGLFID